MDGFREEGRERGGDNMRDDRNGRKKTVVERNYGTHKPESMKAEWEKGMKRKRQRALPAAPV